MALSRRKTVCIKKAFQKAAPTVLTILSSVGVIATAVLSAKAAVRNREQVNNCKEYSDGEIEKYKEYIPAVISGAATIACIFGANALSKRQRVQMAAAYTLLAQSYAQYKNKVVEMCGPETHRSIMNTIALEKARDISIYANTFAGSSTLGFDNMDDHIVRDVIGLALDSEEAKRLVALVQSLAQETVDMIRHEQIEPQSKMAFYAFARACDAMFAIGAAIQLKRMGYKFSKIDN